MKILTDRLVQTCDACPSQWDGITDDGRAVYIRYRHGHLTVSVAAPGDLSKYAAVGGELLLSRDDLNTEHDGVLDEAHLTRILAEHGLGDAQEQRADRPTEADTLAMVDRAAAKLEQMVAAGTIKVLR